MQTGFQPIGVPLPPTMPFRSVVELSLGKLFQLKTINNLYQTVHHNQGREFLEESLSRLGLRSRVEGAGLEAVPGTGPVVVTANHPFGGVDGLLLLSLLLTRRNDVRVMANSLLGAVPQLKDLLIGVDVFAGAGTRRNISPLKRAFQWLDAKGVLLIFPAGQVSALHPRTRSIQDKKWSETASRLIRRAQASVVPVYVHGANGPLFHMAGLLHPRLRTALLPREFVKKRNSEIRFTFGGALGFGEIQDMGSDMELTTYLRARTYALRGDQKRRQRREVGHPSSISPQTPAEVKELLAHPLPEQILARSGPFTVVHVAGENAQHLLDHLGALRESTFRGVGEGTGRDIDVDRYDAVYDHIVCWHEEAGEVAGAYRIGNVGKLLEKGGLKSLYTAEQFRFTRSFAAQGHEVFELGRSFVLQKYQRHPLALASLWKGIAGFVRLHPRVRYLFGPVSISASYSSASRFVMRAALERHMPPSGKTGNWVRPGRRPGDGLSTREKKELHLLAGRAWDMDRLTRLVQDMEPDGKGVPVLLRHYANLGGRALAFRIDPTFQHCLDCLMVVDLAATRPSVLARFMGREESKAFLAGLETSRVQREQGRTAPRTSFSRPGSIRS